MEETVDPTLHAKIDAPASARANDLTGRTLGDFQLVRRIGQGGMGQVYLARQLSLKRQVAVKILRTDLTANETALQRFQLEAEAVARINHANIVQVYAIGAVDGLNYMALEYVEGKNLREYLTKKGPPELPIALNIVRQIAAALQRAHEMGFVHRDIKPENILLTRKAEVKVADFGLSRCFASEQPIHLTQSGVTMGTPLYMSPEQVQGKSVDPRSDIYSFGVTCFHLLTGEPPFRGETPFEVALQHVQNEPPALKDFGVPDELAMMVHKMMAKAPEDRYQSAREVLRDLNRFREAIVSPPSGHALSLGELPVNSAFATRAVAAPSQAVPTRKHSSQWLLLALLMMGGIALGLTIHWRTHPVVAAVASTAATDEEFAEAETVSHSAKNREKELRRLLDDPATKGDAGLRVLLELTQLYLRESRFKEAEGLFDSHLSNKPFIKDVQKAAPKAGESYAANLSRIGLGIVYAHQDLPEKSLAEMALVLPKNARTTKTPTRFVDSFMKRHMEWSKAMADALDRNARNLGGKLEEPFSRYRNYAKISDRS